MMDKLLAESPDVVHVHNLYPLLSPSVLSACAELSIPVVMTLHNFRLICPIGIFFRNGNICEACVSGNEFSCLFKNCRNNLAESLVYSFRTHIASKFRQIVDRVDRFIAPSEFLLEKYMESGFSDEKFEVIPNFTPIPEHPVELKNSEYVAFLGRFSSEKGVINLLAAAELLPEIDIRLAGDWKPMRDALASRPNNVSLMGNLVGKELDAFFRGARFVVVPSVCYEVCPMVVLEAMSYGVPVVASNLGGLPEMVDDRVNGLLFKPGSAVDLAEKMEQLWDDPGLCERFGSAARKKILRSNNEQKFADDLLAVYSDCLSKGKRSL
jgi:glycosyltransferase involved in cell wall biosynthesis